MTWHLPASWHSPAVLAAAALAAAAVLVALPRPGRQASRRRWARLLGHTTSGGPGWSPEGARRRVPVAKVRLVAGLAGIAVALLVGGWFGLLAGVALAVGLERLLRRLEPAARRHQRLLEAASLPLAADLLAVALRSGAPVDQATVAVAQVLPGPLGQRLGRVGRALSLGATPAQAWAELAPVAGADRMVRAAVRSAEHGSALAAALSRLADDLRADRAIAVDAAARRAAVLIVLPLGLCFLPAFVLAGLVPVIIAVLGDVL